MKKILLALTLGAAMIAAVPALAMARGDLNRGHHSTRHEHARVHREDFNRSMVSGKVTSVSEIKCEAVARGEIEHSGHADGDHRGRRDNSSRVGEDDRDNDDRGRDQAGEHTCSPASGAGSVRNDSDVDG